MSCYWFKRCFFYWMIWRPTYLLFGCFLSTASQAKMSVDEKFSIQWEQHLTIRWKRNTHRKETGMFWYTCFVIINNKQKQFFLSFWIMTEHATHRDDKRIVLQGDNVYYEKIKFLGDGSYCFVLVLALIWRNNNKIACLYSV